MVNSTFYDTQSRVKQITAQKGSNPDSVNRAYAYDNSGADSGLLRTMLDSVANTNTGYTYDPVNDWPPTPSKPGSWAGSGTAVSNDSYTYDLNGNLTQQVTAGTTTNYGYNAADQMCWSATATGTGCTTPTGGTTYTYDGNGNTLTGDATTGTNTWSPTTSSPPAPPAAPCPTATKEPPTPNGSTPAASTSPNGLLGTTTHSAGGFNNQQ